MKIHNFIVFDFETGGLDKKSQWHSNKVAITQAAAIGVMSNDFKEIGRFSNFVLPNYDEELEYQQTAFNVTGTSMEMLEKEGVSIDNLISKFIDLFEKTNTGTRFTKPILVGQNVTYDIPFLQRLFSYKKLDLSKWLAGYKDHFGNFHPNYIDTCWLSRIKKAEEGMKHRLGDICQREKVDLVDAHEAFNDVIATLEVFKGYILALRSGQGKLEGMGESIFREQFEI